MRPQANTPAIVDFQPYMGKVRKPGTGCISQINDHLFEGRYSPKWPDGKKHARNVYAHTREECEEKLKVLIVLNKTDIVAGLADARSRLARYWQVQAPAHIELAPAIARLLQTYPAPLEVGQDGSTLARGLRLRIVVQCQGADGQAEVELDFGPEHVFYPSDAALADWRSVVGSSACQVVWR